MSPWPAVVIKIKIKTLSKEDQNCISALKSVPDPLLQLKTDRLT